MLSGTGGCYHYVPSSPPFSGHADGSEQTGCRHANEHPDVELSFQVPAPSHTLRKQVFL